MSDRTAIVQSHGSTSAKHIAASTMAQQLLSHRKIERNTPAFNIYLGILKTIIQSAVTAVLNIVAGITVLSIRLTYICVGAILAVPSLVVSCTRNAVQTTFNTIRWLTVEIPIQQFETIRSRMRRSPRTLHLDKWGFNEMLLRRFSDRWRFKKHVVRTRDGHTLHLFQIVPRDNQQQKDKRVVVMQHGLMENSSVFLLLGKNSLAYRLCVEHGYEVWLANARDWQGAHLPQYSIDELIVDDFPTVVDYVLQVSKPPSGKVAVVGVSQGAVQALGAMAVNGQPLEKKLSMLVLVSPALYTKKPSWTSRGFFVQLLALLPDKLFGDGEFFYGALGFFSKHVPDTLIPAFSWLIMNRLLGIIHHPMFEDVIPLDSASMNFLENQLGELTMDSTEDGTWTQMVQQEQQGRSFDSVINNDAKPIKGNRTRKISIQVTQDKISRTRGNHSDNFSRTTLTVQQESSPGTNSIQIVKLQALCFRHVPGYPSPSARNVVHWLKLVRTGSSLRPFLDEDERDYDYFRYVLERIEKEKNNTLQNYYPPIQVLLGGMDPVIDQQVTKQAVQQLITKHPDGYRRYAVHEWSDFSHVCFFWSHHSVVSSVYDVIIDRIENNGDWQ